MAELNYRLIVPPTVEPLSLSLAKQQLRVTASDEDFLIQTYISMARDYAERITNRAFFPQTWRLSLDSFPYGDYRSTVPIDQRDPWNYSAYWNDLAIRLPKPMTLSITSLTYLDGGGNLQTLDPSLYVLDPDSRPGRIVPAAGYTWPITQFYLPGSIKVNYVASSYSAPLEATLNISSGNLTGTLPNQLISLTSIVDGSGNPVTNYTSALVLDDNGDPTATTQLTFASAPAGNTAVVSYVGSTLPPTILGAMMMVVNHLFEHREANTELVLKEMPLGVKALLKPHIFDIMGNYQIGY